MTTLDQRLSELSVEIDRLSAQSASALFVGCARALLPRFNEWAERRGRTTQPLLGRALATASAFALTGVVADDAAELLVSVEAATPEGDSPDAVSSTPAQDCWICADIAVRVMTQPGYSAGSGIEYALEPLLQAETERVHGVSQLGSGPSENELMDEVLRQPKVVDAFSFCWWAVSVLAERDEVTPAELEQVTRRAGVLSP